MGCSPLASRVAGEQSLEMCDFMLADIADSERINRTIHQKIRSLSPPASSASDAQWVAWIKAYMEENQGSFFSAFNLAQAAKKQEVCASRPCPPAYQPW